MDNTDDSETNAKISDSAYSNSCSNSQSRRSHSSKSTHSGSNSSGSSGYGGKISTSGSSNLLGQPPKKDKESKKKKLSQTEVKAAEVVPADEPARAPEPDPVLAAPRDESHNVVESAMDINYSEMVAEDVDISTPEPSVTMKEVLKTLEPVRKVDNYVTSSPSSNSADGFSVVISMHNGVVMYTSNSLTNTLGFPKDIWIGRSFIDFVHPKDHKTFASLITNGLALPKVDNGRQDKGPQGPGLASGSTMVCRIRRYKNLNSGFGVKDAVIPFMPFLLKFFFKDYSEDDMKVVYLVIQATPFFSAFKIPNEIIQKPVPFVTRHNADGLLEYIDPKSVPYLGYLPQDIQDKNVLHLYHPDDLSYLRQVYESIIKEGNVSSSKPYRIMTQNGHFVRVETEWSSVINPWSMKLEFVIGNHHVIEGPINPDVFQSPEYDKILRISEPEKYRIKAFRDSIVRVLTEARTKPAEAAKQQMSIRCQNLVSFMETLVEEPPKQKEEEELKVDVQENQDINHYERDTLMLGGISPHHDSDSKSSTETPISYNQLNYNENLQRFFNSQEPEFFENYAVEGSNVSGPKAIKPSSKCISPMDQDSGEFNGLSSISSAVVLYVNSPESAPNNCQYVKITETTLLIHNAEMEKEMVKVYRETRSSKEVREKALIETQKKKKEHLTRCNASFYPTLAGDASLERELRKDNMRGMKRSQKTRYIEEPAQKQHCPTSREPIGRQFPVAPSLMAAKPSATITTTIGVSAAACWQAPQNANSYNMYGMGMPQQMPMYNMLALPGPTPSDIPNMASQPETPKAPPFSPSVPSAPIPSPTIMPVPKPSDGNTMLSKPVMPTISEAYRMPGIPVQGGMQAMSVMTGIPGMYPMYYTPPTSTMPATTKQQSFPTTTGYQTPMPYMVHGHPIPMVYGQPFAYPAVTSQMYPLQQSLMSQQSMQYSNSLNLTASNYEQRSGQNSEFTSSPTTSQLRNSKAARTSDENADRTDGESSYSSFYSSFFKTDSGSADDSGDQKKKSIEVKNRFWPKNMQVDEASTLQNSIEAPDSITNDRKLVRRKVNAPWNEKVNLTADLVYKYQMVSKSNEEVLKADKEKIEAMEQPPLVDEQLGQLYLDLQLQGVAARLTLEEGVTSSSSSGEETVPAAAATAKSKREFNKLAIIYEENAPMPAPDAGLLVPEGAPDTDIVPAGFAYMHPPSA